jgi:signal transduction histidine kinase/ActR/RegA family two-component response regulator
MLGDPEYRRLFEGTPQSCLVLARDLTIVAVTNAFLNATMMTRSEIVGRPFFEVFPSQPADSNADVARELRASIDRVITQRAPDRMPIQKYDVRRPHAEGGALEVRYGRAVNSPIVGADGSVDFILHHVEDVTDALAAATRAAKTEFLSSMSHELRTPLNAVLGFAQLLQRDRKQPLTERQHERVRRILNGGEQLLHLVDDVLDLARIEAGRIGIAVEPVDVGEVLADVKRTLEPMETRYGIGIRVETPPKELPRVCVDRRRFAQVIANFCSNALKYNRPHGTIYVSARCHTDDRVRVTVADTGFGIPLSKQSLLFQPFQRAGQETGPIEGTGIGLVITRKLAMLMKGEVGFESVEGEGSTFWVDVPTHRAAKRSQNPLARSAVFRRAAGARRRILYIEDNPANRTLMQDMLSLVEGIDLSTAASGEDGLEMALDNAPDAIILDIHLAGTMTGLEAAKMLRAAPKTRSSLIIGLSAAASAGDGERALGAGFDHYLTKPVVVDELVALLETRLWPVCRATP